MDNYVTVGFIAESDLETTPCPLCKSSCNTILHILRPFKVVTCSDCRLVYLNPRLKENIMRNFYRDNGYFMKEGNAGYGDYLSQEDSLRNTFRRFLGELKRRGLTSGRLLEIGCGYGFFLAEAKDLFSFLAGTELSEEAGGYAERLSGACIHKGDAASLPSELKSFDVIAAINVIEHVYAPAEFLISLKKRLKRGGRIVVATPDTGSFWHRIMGRKWPSLKVPEHVIFYTHETLTALLKQAGFGNILRIPFPHAFPLGLIAGKIGISVHGRLNGKSVWLPKTMVALAAQSND